MSTNTATLDAPSLTLPDWRTALKRRVKRPKLPDKGTLYNLAWNTAGVLFCVFELAHHPEAFWIALLGTWGCGLVESVRKWRRGDRWWSRNPQDSTLRLAGWALWGVALVLFLVGLA